MDFERQIHRLLKFEVWRRKGAAKIRRAERKKSRLTIFKHRRAVHVYCGASGIMNGEWWKIKIEL